MHIREFDLARDYAAAVALWAASGPGVRVGPSDTREELVKKLRRDPDLFLVAEDAGLLIGTVIGGFDGRRGMVYHLAVAASHRGQRIGTELMAELERRFQARGCRKMYLFVTEDNPAALAFYSRLGWFEARFHTLSREIPPAPASEPRD